MKAINETWSMCGSDEVSNEHGTIATFGSEEGDHERARLASAAPDMARVLLALIDPERLDEEGRRAGCPTCGVDTGFESCLPDCALTAALRRAGLR